MLNSSNAAYARAKIAAIEQWAINNQNGLTTDHQDDMIAAMNRVITGEYTLEHAQAWVYGGICHCPRCDSN